MEYKRICEVVQTFKILIQGKLCNAVGQMDWKFNGKEHEAVKNEKGTFFWHINVTVILLVISHIQHTLTFKSFSAIIKYRYRNIFRQFFLGVLNTPMVAQLTSKYLYAYSNKYIKQYI